MVAGTTTAANCGFWSSPSVIGNGAAGAGCFGTAPGADWVWADKTKIGIGDTTQLVAMATARAVCLCRRFPASGKSRDERGVAMRQSGLHSGVGRPIRTIAQKRGQQRVGT